MGTFQKTNGLLGNISNAIVKEVEFEALDAEYTSAEEVCIPRILVEVERCFPHQRNCHIIYLA